VYGNSIALLGRQLAGSLCLAMGIFLGAIVVVSLLGAFESVRPVIAGKPTAHGSHHTDVHAARRSADHHTCQDRPFVHREGRVFRAGTVAVVAIACSRSRAG
jgi:anaerobic C4-dicarboxylate transporter DcuB